MPTVRNAYRERLCTKKQDLLRSLLKANSKLINEIESPAPHTQVRNGHGLPVHLLRLA